MTEAQNESAKKENEAGCSCGQGVCGCHDAEPQTKCACGAEAEAKPAEAKKPTVEELQAALKLSEAKVLEHYDLYVRAMAELENTRRRSNEELIKTRKFAIEKFAENLLPVVDSLEKATYRQFLHALDVSDMKPIDPKGVPFDPHHHQAITMVPAPEGMKSGDVVQVFQRGWCIGDRVLRPAMVSVAQ